VTRAAPERAAPPTYGKAFWLALPVGGLLMAWGAAGLLRNAVSTVPTSWLRWLLGVLLVYHLLLTPAALAAGYVLWRAPAPWRTPLRAALIVSGTLTLTSLPLLLGYGRATQPGNASVLPGNYAANLAAVLAVVWVLAAAWALHRSRRRAR
jgi:purine-cytosine permease-like protein